MIKKTKSISINILSVFIILMCLLIGVVGNTNAWFTSEHQNGIQIVVDVGDLKLKLYQNSIDENGNNLVYTYEENTENETDKYVSLSKEIVPDVSNSLTLILSNEDKGSASMYVRFKFELYLRNRGTTADTKIASTISGYTAQASDKDGFRYNSADGYYYYQSSTGASSTSFSNDYNTKLEKTKNATLLTSFTVPYIGMTDYDGTTFLPGFVDASGNLVNGSETLYIKLTVEASVTTTF